MSDLNDLLPGSDLLPDLMVGGVGIYLPPNAGPTGIVAAINATDECPMTAELRDNTVFLTPKPPITFTVTPEGE